VVESGRWLMYRYHPDLAKEGKNPLQLDSRAPKLTVAQTLQGCHLVNGMG